MTAEISLPGLHLAFAPEHWTKPGLFLAFVGPPFRVSRQLNDAVRSCVEHIRKFQTLATLVADLQPTLALDRDELERDGHTQAHRSRQFTALIEVMFCELYSTLDGVRYTVLALYRKCRGVQERSTSKLFSRAAARDYGPEFPEEIRLVLAAAHESWFPELRRLRTAFTHGGLGSCMLSQDRHSISYMNPSLGDEATAHVIPDIVSHLNHLASATFAIVDAVFSYLYGRLEPEPKPHLCGVYKHRMYMREVTAELNLSQASGRCMSRSWFDSDPDHRCPVADRCQAYARSAA